MCIHMYIMFVHMYDGIYIYIYILKHSHIPRISGIRGSSEKQNPNFWIKIFWAKRIGCMITDAASNELTFGW